MSTVASDMSYKELAEALRAEGFQPKSYAIEYMITNGLVDRPEIRSGRRVFLQRHFEQIRARLQAKATKYHYAS